MNFSVKYFLFVFVQLGSAICFSQSNLVPNPGFEDMILCPNNGANLINTKYWTNPNLSSPDYFHTCGVSGYGVPSNVEGFQIAHSGNAYAGFIAFAMPPWPSSSFREYVQVRLDSNFVKDEIYCVTYYVSLADSLSEYAVNNIGAYFSSIAVSSSNYDPLPFNSQVTNTSANPLTDTSGWTRILGQFKAQGGERYITIGNFNSNAASDTVFIQKTTPSYKTAYYYIDDVSVIHINAGAGKARTVCNGVGAMLGRPTQPGITYLWWPAAGLSDTAIAQPIATPTVTTTYYLTATLTGSGCSKTDSVTVYYVPDNPSCNCNENIFVANVFSPNNDGKNDVLYVQGTGITNLHWSIYNRWGNLVFETKDAAKGWNGSYNGSAAEAGTYMYYLTGICTETNSEVKLKGNVSIVK